MDGGRDLSGRELNELLRPHAEALALRIFPAAKRDGPYLTIGSLHGEPGKSLKIKVRGADAGSWADYATSKSDPRGKGDLIDLLRHTLGDGSHKSGFAEARKYLSLDTMDPGALDRQRERARRATAKQEREKASLDERKRLQAEGLWQAASALTPASPAVRYLESRGIDFGVLGRLPGAIRFRSGVWHAELRHEVPAMVTKFTALTGAHAATHVTYLEYRDGQWGKLTGVERTKIIRGPAHSLRAHLPLWKGAQRAPLRDLKPGTPVEVSEGIEDGLSFAMATPEARVVAAGTLGLIEVLALPPQAGDLTLLAQNDTKAQPIEALERAVRAQQAQAREQGSARQVRLRRPPDVFKDWNDWLNAGALPPDGCLSDDEGGAA